METLLNYQMGKMEIQVNKSKQLKQIQEEFQSNFPFLKLEFYSSFHKSGEGSEKSKILNNALTVGQVSKLNNESFISISDTMKVSELEKAFRDTFGLSVQIFRKSNNLWLQTTITDNWTLSKQNKSAAEMNIQENLSSEPEDIHEQE